ncbi:MAG: FtsK/SpoIIIE domain-containing protein [Actinomycetota bacterium]
MRVVHRDARGERIVDIEIDDPDRTVGDLLVALGSTPSLAAFAVVDGTAYASSAPLRDVTLCHGSVVAVPSPATADARSCPDPAVRPDRMLAVTGGVWAGRAVHLSGPVVVGRDPACDLTIDDAGLCATHMRLESAGSLTDLGSRNGVAIEGHPVRGTVASAVGHIRAGTSRFAVRSPVDDRPVAVSAALGEKGGTIPFNRPPRTPPPTVAAAFALPEPRPEPPEREPLSLAGIVLPVIAGAVVALLFSPFMAIFAALGPVLTVGTWWERRRRARRAHAAEMRAFHAALDALVARLPAARLDEVERRRALHPDPAEVVRRATDLSVRLWERRFGDDDAFIVAIGGADETMTHGGVDGEVAGEALQAFLDQPRLPDVPVAVALGPGAVLGIVGERAAQLSVARSLVVQMATHHGPADLAVLVAADDPAAWTWTTWFPHGADHAAGRAGANLVRTTDQRLADHALAALGDRTMLAVLDGDDPLQGRLTAGRTVLGDERVAAIVLVPDEHRLPARCTAVARVDELGRLELVDPRRPGNGRRALAWGLPLDVAEGAARGMARLDDPELPIAGAGVPSAAPLLGLLGIDGDDAAAVESRWRVTDGTADLVVPIGADGDGPVQLDLVADGPHLLVGGTTGSGKSELLRSLVAGVAASADPDHVAMVLIDYKGGAAFDCCADLPHVAGLVTDLDADLAARALRCLEGELHHREERLRAVGAEDLAAFRRAASPDASPLPRLLVVIDEFATLAADLPDFVDALVGIAQRGRSLGVHLVLATQRPAGVVTDDIRANTACRIALRVTDRNDSIDVIDAPDAAAIPRDRPGRAVARLGPGELSPFQSALVTGHSIGRAGVSVRDGRSARDVATSGPSDLERLVSTIGRAHSARGGRLPRSPWPDPLPARVHRADLPGADPGSWMLVDEPERQRQRSAGWCPSDGHLVVVGAPGSGVSSTLTAAALAAARVDRVHLHAIDLAGDLAPLAGLEAAGTVAGPVEGVRRARLLRWLDDEVARRRGDPDADAPRLLVLVDDLGGLARAHDPVREPEIHDRFARIWSDGPGVGVTVAASVRRGADLPPALAASVDTVLLHRSADPGDAMRFGQRASLADLPPGRAVRAGDGRHVQVALDALTIAEAVDAFGGAAPERPPHDVGELPAEIGVSHPAVGLSVLDDAVTVTIAVGDRDLTGQPLRLFDGEHALVIGPARSGRTNTLAAMHRAAGDAAIVVGDGALARRCGVIPTMPATLDTAIQGRGATLVLVDDATDVDDPTGALAALVVAPPPGVHVVAAVRPDRLRGAYGHWVTEIRASRKGVLLRPDPMDADLLGAQLPPRLTLPPHPGRGVIVDDAMEVVQVVRVDQSTS